MTRSPTEESTINNDTFELKSIDLPGACVKNIVYLSRQNLDARNFERFGIRLFKESGFNVEYWDFTPVLHPDVFKTYKEVDYINYEGLKIFYEEKEIYNRLSSLKSDTFVIDLIDFDFNYIKLYRALSRSKADYAVNMSNALPDIREVDRMNRLYSVLSRKIKKASMLSHGELWRSKVLPMLPLKLFGIKPAKFILAGGEISVKKYHFPIDKTTKILWAHTFDYDIYLKELSNKSAVRPTAVFLDVYYPFNPGWIYAGTKCKITPDKYYSLLNRFFDRVEKELNVEVIIAAHPRSNYENMPDYFMGRKCVKGETAKLVKESRLVLSHNSTSINFANLFYKPIIFMTYAGYGETSMVKVMAELHGKKVIFIDRELNIDWEDELKVNISCYRNYRQAFIKTEKSQDIPFWQILAKRLIHA